MRTLSKIPTSTASIIFTLAIGVTAQTAAHPGSTPQARRGVQIEPSQHEVITGAACGNSNRSSCADEAKEKQKKAFESGRALLFQRGVPFEPNDLLDKNWHKNLRPILDSMSEMHDVRRETDPLKGAYIADTLYLPEQTSVDDDIVIIANAIVFEGRNPTIKGNHDVNVFLAGPTVVLGTTLAEALNDNPTIRACVRCHLSAVSP